jgi:sarcosine oxidase, subunit gamma
VPDVVATEFALERAWNVRGNAAHPAFVAAVSDLFGMALPVRSNSSAVRGDRRLQDSAGRSTRVDDTLLWLGPASWLFVGSGDGNPRDFDVTRLALNAAGGALFDVSASYVAWSVSGEDAARVLNRGCPLDLDARVFRAGHCAQSLLGHVAALLHRPDASSTFIVMVPRSFAADVRHLLKANGASIDERPAPVQRDTVTHTGA